MALGELENGMKTVEQDAGRLEKLEKLEQVLGEVCDLLEAYGPFWYNEPLRDRVRSALELGGPTK